MNPPKLMARFCAIFTSFSCYWGNAVADGDDECSTDCTCADCSTLPLEKATALCQRKLKTQSLVHGNQLIEDQEDGKIQCGAFLQRRRKVVDQRFDLGSGVMLISLKQASERVSSGAVSFSNTRGFPLNTPRIQSYEQSQNNTGNNYFDELDEGTLGYALASSMLQQILKDMYIDPDLLAELDEEQKQVLFCKMREEQIRRWEETEKKLEKENKKTKSPKALKNGQKKIDFLIGSDGNPWVWVMGEHTKDSTIDQILEKEAHEHANKLAEEETESLSSETNAEVAALEPEETDSSTRTQMEEELKINKAEEQSRLEYEKRQHEEELQKKAEEAAIYQSLKEAKILQQKIEEEKKKKEEEDQKKTEEITRRHEFKRQSSIQEVNNLVSRRRSEIYMSLKKAQEQAAKQAEETSGTIEKEWAEQEKKSKLAEAEVRAVARRAREEHRRSLQMFRTEAKTLGAVMHRFNTISGHQSENKPAVPKKPGNLILSSGKPQNKAAVQAWFKKVERPRGAGKLSDSEDIAPWFHGIISRQKAEKLLENSKKGTFLVRISERIWGYAISYKSDEKIKHFLIDAGDGTYQFFGTNQLVHRSLAELVTYHTEKPVSHSGKEYLQYPCGQQKGATPDYEELFSSTDNDAESSQL